MSNVVSLPPLNISGGNAYFKLKNGTDVLGRIDIDGSENLKVSIQDGPELYRRFTIEAGKFLAFLEGESRVREACLPANPGKFFAKSG